MVKRDSRFDLIVFDWDGTLMDSTALIVRSIQAACSDLGLPVPPPQTAAHVIGLSLQAAMHYIAPHLDEAGAAQLAERYREHYLAKDHELMLFEGAMGLLHWLKSREYLVAIATGKARRGLSRVLESTGIGAFFHASRCADESSSKPHPAMLFELMEEMKVQPDRTLMIGDTTHDLLMAANAGVKAVAVSYGAHGIEELRGAAPLAIVHSMTELETWLRHNG